MDVRTSIRRYSRPVPGDRVQLDVRKIAPRLYQYTAVDDCSRFQVLGLYRRRTAANTLAFLEQVLEEMPFPVQRIQTDRGQEFFAYKVQEQLQAWRIKFRPIRPRSPHLNGKVERAQRTALEEFWATADLNGTRLSESWPSGRPSSTLLAAPTQRTRRSGAEGEPVRSLHRLGDAARCRGSKQRGRGKQMSELDQSRRSFIGAGSAGLTGGFVASAAAASLIDPKAAYAQAGSDSLLRTVLDRGKLIVGTG